MLQGMESDGSLKQGSVTTIAKRFGVACCTVHHLWKQAAHTHATVIINSLEFYSGGKSRRPPIYLTEFVHEGVKNAWVFLLVLVVVWYEFNVFLSNLKYIGILGFIFT